MRSEKWAWRRVDTTLISICTVWELKYEDVLTTLGLGSLFVIELSEDPTPYYFLVLR